MALTWISLADREQVSALVALWPALVAEHGNSLYPFAPGFESKVQGRLHALSADEPVQLPDSALLSSKQWAAWNAYQAAVLTGDPGHDAFASYLFGISNGDPDRLGLKPDDLTTMSPAELLRALSDSLPITSDHLVIWLDESDWLLPAAFYAVAHGLPLLRAESPARAGALALELGCRTLTVVASPGRFDGWACMELYRATMGGRSEWQPQQMNAGLLTGRSPSVAFDLAVRSLVYRASQSDRPERHVITIMADPDYDGAVGIDETEVVIPFENALLATLSPNVSDRSLARTFNLMAHGRDDSIWLKDALICGKADVHERVAPPDRGLPACAYTGECYRPERLLLNAADIQAEVAFINSCSALKPAKSTFPLAYNTTMRFLDGWLAACVASPFMVDGRFFQNLLFHQLYLSGVSVGEAVRAVNNATLAHGLDFPGLMVLGDPEFRMARKMAPLTMVWSRSQQSLQVVPEGARTVVITVPGAAQAARCGQLKIRVTGKVRATMPVYQVLVPEPRDESAHVYLISLSPLPQQLQLEWVDEDLAQRARRLHHQFQSQNEKMESLGIRLQEMVRLTPEVRNAARNIDAVSHEYQYHVQKAATLEKKVAHLERLCGQAERLLIDWLLDATHRRNYHFTEQYRRSFDFAGMGWPNTSCPYCDDPLYHMEGKARLWQVTRTIALCPTCGVIDDVPTAGFPVSAELTGTAEVTQGGVCEQRLVLHNQSNERITGFAGVRLVLGNLNGVSVEPDLLTVVLEPGGRQELSFAVRASADTRTHQYWLRAYVVAQGDVRVMGRNLWVVPPPALRPES